MTLLFVTSSLKLSIIFSSQVTSIISNISPLKRLIHIIYTQFWSSTCNQIKIIPRFSKIYRNKTKTVKNIFINCWRL